MDIIPSNSTELKKAGLREICEKFARNMKELKSNMNFIMAGDKKKSELMRLLTDYKHNASKWHYAKRKEVEEELRHYGLIEF